MLNMIPLNSYKGGEHMWIDSCKHMYQSWSVTGWKNSWKSCYKQTATKEAILKENHGKIKNTDIENIWRNIYAISAMFQFVLL